MPDPEDTAEVKEPTVELTIQVTRANGTVEAPEILYSENHPNYEGNN